MNGGKKRKRKTTPATMRVEGEMTVRRGTELRDQFIAALERDAALDVDLSSVTRIDTAGVQLLLRVGSSARASGKIVRFVAPSGAVIDCLKLLNLTSCLDTPPLEGARGAS